MRAVFTVAQLTVLCACFPLFAQQAGESALDWFHRMDRNNDGKLTYDEVPSPRFKEFDTNGDGFVTEEEFKTHIGRAASGQRPKQQSPGSTGISDELMKALAYHRDSPGPVPLSDSKAFTDVQFQIS